MVSIDELRPPLFVKPDEPLFVFDSVHKVLQIEWQDLEDAGYVGYDADGRPFRVEARTWKRKFLGLELPENGETTLRVLDSSERPDELRGLLISALAGGDPAARADLESRSLNELQMRALERYGFE